MDGGWLLPVITASGAEAESVFSFWLLFLCTSKEKVTRPGEGGNLGSMTGNVNSWPTGKSDERPSIHALRAHSG